MISVIFLLGNYFSLLFAAVSIPVPSSGHKGDRHKGLDPPYTVLDILQLW